jgi:hypothetical protein
MRMSAPRALVVLGMHRSGTSALSAMLCTAGADAPRDLLGANQYNETGHWEPAPLPVAHDELLAAMDVAWHTTLSYPVGFFSSPKVEPYRVRLAGIIQEQYRDSRLFCLKDPRMSRLLPLWRPLLNDLGIDAGYVIMVRNPVEVAQSLKKRDDFPQSKSLMLWLRHTLEAEKETRGCRRVFVTFDQLCDDWRRVLGRIGSALNVGWPKRMTDVDVEFDNVFSQELRHHRSGFDMAVTGSETSQWVAQTYKACLAAAADEQTDVLSLFDRVGAELSNADKAFEPLFALEKGLFEERVADLEAERDARLHAISVENAGLQEKVAGLESALEAVTTQTKETERERISLAENLKAAQAKVVTLTRRYEESRQRILDQLYSLSRCALQIAGLQQIDEDMAFALTGIADEVSRSRQRLLAVEEGLLQRGDVPVPTTAPQTNEHDALSSVRARFELKKVSQEQQLLEVTALRTQQDDLRAELLVANAAIDDLRSTIGNLQGEMENVVGRASVSEQALAQAQAAHRQISEASAGKLAALHMELNAAVQEIAERDRCIAARSTELGSVRAKLMNAEAEAVSLSQAFLDQQTRRSELEASLVDLENKLQENEGALRSHRARAEARGEREAELLDQHARMQASLSAREADVLGLESRMAEQAENLRVASSECDRLGKELLSRESDLDRMREELHERERIRIELEAARAQLKTQEVTLLQLKAELALSEEQIDALRL